MKYKLICFDMDGVLFSSKNILETAYQYAIKKYNNENKTNLISPKKETILKEIGKPVKQIFKNLFPGLKEQDQKFISLNVLDKLLEEIKNKKGALLPNVYEVLKKLHNNNFLISLASNGREPYLMTILKTYDILDFFHSINFINNDSLPTKGSLIINSMNKFSISNQETLMIGDRLVDFEAANEANVDFVLIKNQHNDEFKNCEVKFMIENITEILEILK